MWFKSKNFDTAFAEQIIKYKHTLLKSKPTWSKLWSCTAWKVSKYGVFSYPYSVRMRENTDQKKLRIWTLMIIPCKTSINRTVTVCWILPVSCERNYWLFYKAGRAIATESTGQKYGETQIFTLLNLTAVLVISPKCRRWSTITKK